jgi:hypothetical protein
MYLEIVEICCKKYRILEKDVMKIFTLRYYECVIYVQINNYKSSACMKVQNPQLSKKLKDGTRSRSVRN